MQSQHVLSCRCGEIILKGSEDHTKVRSRVLVFKGLDAYAVCKGCGAEVAVPISIEVNMLKSLPVCSNPRLFISNTHK